MKKNLFLIFLIILTFHGEIFAQTSEEFEDIKVEVGIAKVIKLNFRPSTKVEIGNEEVLNVVVSVDRVGDRLNEVTLNGIKPDKSSLIIRDQQGNIRKKYRVEVISSDLSKIVIRLRDFFNDIEGIRVVIRGGIVVVEGELIVPKDIGKIAVVINREEFRENVISLVQLSPQTQRIIAKRMQEEIHRNGMKDVTVRVVNRQYWLEGFVTKAPDKKLANDIAQNYLTDKIPDLGVAFKVVSEKRRVDIANFIAVNEQKAQPPPVKMLKILAQFVELTKDYEKIFGFKWTPLLRGTGGSIQFGKTAGGEFETNSQGTFSGIITNLFPKLSSAKSAGNARVVQQGMIVMKEVKQGQNLVGKISKSSTIPFALGTGDFTQSKEAKAEFSVEVNSPTIVNEENVDLPLGVTISAAIGSPPITHSNSVSTRIVVKSKSTAVIGGMSLTQTSTNYDKNPPFGQDQFEADDDKPLFSFVRSKAFTTNKSQFVVFVTPEILDNASRDTKKILSKFSRRRR